MADEERPSRVVVTDAWRKEQQAKRAAYEAKRHAWARMLERGDKADEDEVPAPGGAAVSEAAESGRAEIPGGAAAGVARSWISVRRVSRSDRTRPVRRAEVWFGHAANVGPDARQRHRGGTFSRAHGCDRGLRRRRSTGVEIQVPAQSLLVPRGDWINAKFPADMREFRRIGEAPVGHHRPQRRVRPVSVKNKRGSRGDGFIRRIRPRSIQAFRGGRQFRLFSLRATSPHFQLEPLRHCRVGREKPIQLGPYVGSLDRCQVGRDRVFGKAHGGHR